MKYKSEDLPIVLSNDFNLDTISINDEKSLTEIVGKHILYNIYENDNEFTTHIGKVLNYNDMKLKVYDSYEILTEEQRKSLEDTNNNYEITIDINNIKDIMVLKDFINYDSNREIFLNELENYCDSICEITNVYDNKIIVYLWNNNYCDNISVTFEYRDNNENIIKCIYPTCMIKSIKKA